MKLAIVILLMLSAAVAVFGFGAVVCGLLLAGGLAHLILKGVLS